MRKPFKNFNHFTLFLSLCLMFMALVITRTLLADSTITAQSAPAAVGAASNPWTWMILGLTHLAMLIGGIFAAKQSPQQLAPDIVAIAAAAAPLVAKGLTISGDPKAAAIANAVGDLAKVAATAGDSTAHVTQTNGAPHAVINAQNQQMALTVATAAVQTVTALATAPTAAPSA